MGIFFPELKTTTNSISISWTNIPIKATYYNYKCTRNFARHRPAVTYEFINQRRQYDITDVLVRSLFSSVNLAVFCTVFQDFFLSLGEFSLDTGAFRSGDIHDIWFYHSARLSTQYHVSSITHFFRISRLILFISSFIKFCSLWY